MSSDRSDNDYRSGIRFRRGARWLAVGLALTVAGVVVASATVEVFLRVTGYHQPFAQPDATIGYVLTPQFSRVVPVLGHAAGSAVFRTNNLGLRRDDDTSVEKPTGTQRVLVLGDSQTEGIVRNEETYCARLERGLNEGRRQGSTTPRRVEVLNAAVSGYSPLLEYLWLRERGRVLRPDVVLLAIYAGNDIGELLMHYEDFAGFGPRFTLPSLEQTNGKWQIILPGAESGALGRFDWWLQTQLRSYTFARRTLSQRPAANQDTALHQVIRRSPGCLQSIWQALISHGDVAELAGGFARLDYLLGQFQEEARALDARLLVVVIPSKLETEQAQTTAAVQDAMQTLGLHYDAAAFDRAIRQRIVALAQQHGIATVDLLPALERRYLEHQQPLYWELDWHLNVDGHCVVAEHLMPIVSGLLQAEPATRAN